MFETFCIELQKYDSGVHRLYPPASHRSIADAEQLLNVNFTEDYKAFLRKWNGGVLFAKDFFDLLIWSVTDKKSDAVKEYDCDLVDMNKTLVMEQDHPNHLLAVASYSDGNLVCLDLRHDGAPVLWHRDDGLIEQRWDSLEDWLNHEMREGAAMYDYHGNDIA